jgi:hypothetical protein
MLFILFIYLSLRLTGTHTIIIILLLGVLYSVAINFAGERPQLFTFLMFSATLYILKTFRNGNLRAIYLIPLLVLISSNMHPGFIVLILLLFIYLSGTLTEYLKKEQIWKLRKG